MEARASDQSGYAYGIRPSGIIQSVLQDWIDTLTSEGIEGPAHNVCKESVKAWVVYLRHSRIESDGTGDIRHDC